MDSQSPQAELEDSQIDDLETQQNKIAEQLSELSTSEVLPVGFKSVSDPFESGDVDFSSSGWLLRVLQVQAWLYPDAEIDVRKAEANPISCAKDFFKAIGTEAPQKCVDGSSGVAQLTPDGAEHLAGRLDVAVSLQQQFSESLEEFSKKQATEHWAEAWDEEVENNAPSLDPIKAKSDTWRINDFSGKASKGLLNLNPSYQRGDVWPTSDAQKLIESILRGIPLPSIILLRPQGNTQAKYEVVDGKQRLTSILRFIGQHPQAIDRVKKMDALHPEARLKDHFHDNYKKFRRAWKTYVGESLTDKREAEYYFPFRLAQTSKALRGPLASLAGKYYYEIRDQTINVGEAHEAVSDVFEGAGDYKIPLIEYLDATPKQIHEVFHLYNRQGKHLNAEEIRNALFHDVDLVRLVLVASGDNPNPAALARYFPESEYQLFRNISRCLDGYRFGSARYKRTKLLSWLYALLFQSSETDGELTIRSTARQIDTLLKNIQDATASGDSHRLANQKILIQLIRDTDRCLDAHSCFDWDSKFKDNDTGLKWQELQLVASLVAVFLIGVLENSPSDLLDSHRDALLEFTRNHPRPEKTQNKTQWAFIGEVALGILDVVGVDQKQLETDLNNRYGLNCLPTLRSARALYASRTAA